MKEREQVFVQFRSGGHLEHADAEVTRNDDMLVLHADAGWVYRIPMDAIDFYSVAPVGVKNLDD